MRQIRCPHCGRRTFVGSSRPGRAGQDLDRCFHCAGPLPRAAAKPGDRLSLRPSRFEPLVDVPPARPRRDAEA
jgi:hypothetical protein